MATAFRLSLLFAVWLGTVVSFKNSKVVGNRLQNFAPIVVSPIVTGSVGLHRPRSTALYGIPKLFRWLVDLYPIVLESVGESLTGGTMQVDNFYLDMNGIIHTCTHSNNDRLVKLDEREMFKRIFAYTDRLYKLVKPTKLMFLAVDGVAPRAKMNQQRSRRFRSSKEREVLLADYIAKEGSLPPDESFDSNCITPGTEFMFNLGIAFRKWIAYKMETDPFWQDGAEVVFSGPDVPGEGEHKVMDMIRDIQKNDPSYERGKLRHCMYGLDADLIMLSLVTHEPLFILLREKISVRKQSKDVMSYTPEDFELLEISLLRKMLKQHFRKLGNIRESGVSDSSQDSRQELIQQDSVVTEQKIERKELHKVVPVKDLELDRIIDDFVFMCVFVGNDFLPCLPHLDIADGSLNLMMNVYRDILPSLGGYLTDKSSIHLPRLELFLQEVARREPLYFQQRAVDEKDDSYASDGYKAYYYQEKFGFTEEESATKEKLRPVIQSYLEGLAWVMEYYHNGCGSWTWYYPYLYCPLATDMKELPSYSIKFEVGLPFTPLLQLLSVLPPQSGSFLPPSYEYLMTNPSSALVDYYPKDFQVDANGKKNSWECIVKIPFINEEILLDSVNEIDHAKQLTTLERQRNIMGLSHRFKPPSWVNGVHSAKRTVERRPEGWGSALVPDGRKGGYSNQKYNNLKSNNGSPPNARKVYNPKST